MTIVAAADGSALGNPGPAGWAWYVDDDRWAAGGWPRATNNQGELTAVLQLLRATKGTGEPLRILCDSQYAIKACTEWLAGWKRKGWRKADGKPVLNVEIIKELDAELQGCPFAPRCDMAQSRCVSERPELRSVGDGHSSACHFASSVGAAA